MVVLELSREKHLKNPWYHLVLREHGFEKIFCPAVWESLFPNMILNPGESRQVAISLTQIIEVKNEPVEIEFDSGIIE